MSGLLPKIIVLLVISLGIQALIRTIRQQRQRRHRVLLDAAREDLNRHFYSRAIQQYSVLIKQHPQDPILYVERSLAYIESNHREKALADLSKVNLSKVQDAGVRGLAGILYLRLGEYEQAEQATRLAIRLNPDAPEVRQALSEIYMRQRKWAEAAQVLLGLANDHPTQHHYWNQLGVAYYLSEQYPEALDAFNQALGECQDAEEKSTILSNRAQALLYMGRSFEALDSAVWALQHDDNNPQAYWYRGIVRMELGETEKAFLDFERAMVLHEEDPWYLNYSDN
ncbi:MAG: tetratricopeptide repeat protein [Bacteroidetes bacterium]|nr:tetratricopeptide repeat protein [Bacteroidota bacterium]